MVKVLLKNKKPDALRLFYHERLIPKFSLLLKLKSQLVIIGAGVEWDYANDFKQCKITTTEIDPKIPATIHDDICASKMPSRSADGIIFMGMWETVANPFLAFDHVGRILKVGGYLLFGAPYRGQPWSQDFWRITPKGLRKLLFDHYDFATQVFYNFKDDYLFTIARKLSDRQKAKII